MTPQTKSSRSDDRTLPVLTHILAYLFSFLAPLIILLASESEYVKKHARRALNWQLSFLLYTIGLVIVMFISIPLMAVVIGFVTIFIAVFGLIALSIVDLVFSIIAAVRASNDEIYTYPITLTFVRDPKVEKKPSEAKSPKTAEKPKVKRVTKVSDDAAKRAKR